MPLSEDSRNGNQSPVTDQSHTHSDSHELDLPDQNHFDGLSDLISREGLECIDFWWSLFSVAVASYKCESLIKPFPKVFTSRNGEKDSTALKRVVASMPSMLDTIKCCGRNLSPVQNNLLHWVLETRPFQLHLLDNQILESLRTKTGEHIAIAKPTHIYELHYCKSAEERFQVCKGSQNLIYAYHGSKVENFYSILKHGLSGHMNKTSLFGQGTYLSVEPTVALGFSPWGLGWKKSSIGHELSVIALCEVINHPSVKYQSDGKHSRTGRRAPNSEGGDVPDKYVVVTNDDMVRVKYLLVYSQKSRVSVYHSQGMSHSMAWIRRHKQKLLMCFYVFLLMLIGLGSSRRFWRQLQQFYQMTFDMLDQQ